MGAPRLRYVFGVDPFQALQLSFDYLAIRIAAAKPRPFLFDREDGGCITRSLPIYLPLKSRKRLEAIIEREGLRWARRQKRSAAHRKRAGAELNKIVGNR
jgi:hypothetical protein